MSLFIFNKDSGWQPRFARQPFCTRKNHQKIYKSLKKLFPSKKGDLKKKLTCWGIEPRLYEMHEFLQVDFCKFLPVAFATKNPRQIFDATSMYGAESEFDSHT